MRTDSTETSWALKAYLEGRCINACVLVILRLLDVFELSQVLFDRSPSFFAWGESGQNEPGQAAAAAVVFWA